MSSNDYMIQSSCKTEGKLSVTLLYLGSFIIQDSKTCYTARNMLKKEFSLTIFFHMPVDPYLGKMNQRKARILVYFAKIIYLHAV